MLCCALLWSYIDWFSHIHQAYFTGTVAIVNLTIAPVPAKQRWWIWINTSCEFIMNDCITTTKQSTTKPCAYFLGYTVYGTILCWDFHLVVFFVDESSLVYISGLGCCLNQWYPSLLSACDKVAPNQFLDEPFASNGSFRVSNDSRFVSYE